MGERTGKKANPEEIERQMRNARNERNERLFQREEWLTKTRIMFFFFTLHFTAENSRSGCYIKGRDIWFYSRWEWRHRRPHWRLWSQQFAWRYSKQNWTIVYDTYDLCAYHKEGKLQAFNVAMLKTILRHFEVPFRAKDRKTDLIRLLTEVIQECNCWKESTVAFIKQKGQQYRVSQKFVPLLYKSVFQNDWTW